VKLKTKPGNHRRKVYSYFRTGQGRKVGLEEGKHQKAIEFARKMKQDGVPMAQIMRYTDLSAEEIEKL
jgi:predicted transposase/invertase (TIGR01784 family)